MGRVGKKFTKAQEAVTKPHYPLPEAVATVAKAAFAKFDETVEVALRLGVDPKHADQMVRGTVILPHGLGGKSKSVLVVASGEKLKEAQDAGADFVGRRRHGRRRSRTRTGWTSTPSSRPPT